MASVTNINKNTLYMAYYNKTKTYTVAELTRKYNVSRGTVYQSNKYFESSYKDNGKLREQIIYGSILGDGYLQNIDCGKYYKYRETHSIAEAEYAMWKYLMLDDWTNNTKICKKNRVGETFEAVELFTTLKVSDVIKTYYELDIDDAIDKIEIDGLIIFLLDDGWYSDHSIQGNYLISSGMLTINQLNKIVKKFEQYGIEATLIGKRNDISINSNANMIIFSYLHRIFGFIDIDIINKKFGRVIELIQEKIA